VHRHTHVGQEKGEESKELHTLCAANNAVWCIQQAMTKKRQVIGVKSALGLYKGMGSAQLAA
jgi:hypothetical protein